MTREVNTEELVEAVENYVTPLATTAPDADPVSLEPLLKHLQSRTIVGMGESTHGTREFFRFKHRLFRALVNRLDVRLFGLEANFPETLAVNEYVLHGSGDPEIALDGIPAHVQTWVTEEMLALVEWVRSYNRERPESERVRFYGFDAQFTAGAVDALEDYLNVVDPEVVDTLDATLQMLADEGLTIDDEDRLRSRLDDADRLVSTLEHRLEAHRDTYVAQTSERVWALARQHVRVIDQVSTLKRIDIADDPFGWYETRDRAMAENVSWILDHEASDRIALWAHNGHIGKGQWQGEATTMGTALAEQYGDGYYALGFDFGHGSFQASVPSDDASSGLREFTLTEPLPEAAGTVLERVDGAMFFLDVNAASADPRLQRLLCEERLLRSVGSIFRAEKGAESHATEYVLCEEFDGLLFVRETTRARPLGWS